MRANFIWLILWAAVAALGSFYLRPQADPAADLKSVAAAGGLHQKHADELTLTEQNLRAQARQNSAKREMELERAWGGPLSAAFRNPEFSLREALQRGAEICAPTNSVVRAEVDRFTEFTVTIDSAETISTNQMIAFARKYLPFAKEHLDSLRFSLRGTLLAELDRQDIEFVDDWAQVTDQRIAMLLPREIPSRATADPAAVGRLRDEQRIAEALSADPSLREKTGRADQKIREASQQAFNELINALQAAQTAMNINDARSFRDLEKCGQAFQSAVEHVARAKGFWTNPAKRWEETLDAEGISGDLREVLIKGFSGMFRSDDAKTKKLFEAVDGQMESCRYVLKLLTEGTDHWKFSATGGIVFTEEEFAKRVERARAQVRDDARAVDEALRDWR